MNGGSMGPTGPQGAQGSHCTIAGEPDGVLERELKEKLAKSFRQDGARSGRIPSIQREAIDMAPSPDVEHDPIRPGPTLKGVAEKKISTFFKASTHFRAGLPVACPFCNAAMTVRIRGRDGRAFLGCTCWPNCSGSWDVPDAAQEEAKRWERAMMTPDHTQAMMPKSVDQAAEMAYMEAAKKDADFVVSVNPGLPPGTITEIRGGIAYAAGQAVGKVVRDVIDEELDKVPARKRGKVSMKEAAEDAMTDAPSSGIKARLARSAAKAPYRVARMRALTEGKKAILGVLRKRVQPATFDLVEAFLETDAGQGAILGIVGLAGPYTPKIGKNKHVQAVCEEFLDEGVAKGANEVFGLLGMILEPVLKSVMSSLPEVNEIADKVVPKRRKKRVATPSEVRVQREGRSEVQEEEEEESEPVRPKNALRAIPR